jgi:Tfp pilus assembly protein PilV
MTTTRRTRLRGLRDRLSGDGGFALIEVMVSAVLLVVLATATLNIIDRSGTASATTRSRTAATGLAQQDQDGMRVMSVDQLDQRDTTYPKVLAGITYSVHSTASWVRDTGDVTCSSDTSRVEYLKTTSSVTWPGHESNPVILESYISPGVEAIGRGSLMVKLHSDAGIGTPGILVSLSNGQSATTDGNGCALFTAIDPAALTASWDGSGGDLVDRNGVQKPSEPVTVGAGQTAQVDRLFDKAGKLAVQWVDEKGAPIPTTGMTTPLTTSGSLGAGVTHTSITNPVNQVRLFDNNTSSVAAGQPLDPHIPPTNPTTIGELFPFVQGYSVFAGGCAANNPTTYLSSYAMPTGVVPRLGGTSTTLNVTLPTAAVYLNGAVASGGTVTNVRLINQSGDVNCIDSTSLGSPALASGTPVVFHVPYGQYTVCVQKSISGVSWTATTNPSAPFNMNVTPPGSTSPYVQTHATAYDGTNNQAAGTTITLGTSGTTNTTWVRGTC